MGSSRVRGEAVVVALGRKGYVFMILCGAKDFSPSGIISSVLLSMPNDARKWELNEKALPRFVAFKDLTDSKSVVSLEPSEFEDYFGDSTRLVSVTAEHTSQKITNGHIKSVLPWLTPNSLSVALFEAMYLNGEIGTRNQTLADRLQYVDFIGSAK